MNIISDSEKNVSVYDIENIAVNLGQKLRGLHVEIVEKIQASASYQEENREEYTQKLSTLEKEITQALDSINLLMQVFSSSDSALKSEFFEGQDIQDLYHLLTENLLKMNKIREALAGEAHS